MTAAAASPASAEVRRPARWLRLLLFAVVAGVALAWAYLFWAALNSVPMLAGDHAFFTPVVQQMRLTGELTQPWVLHMAGTKFNWHSWLYPTLASLLPFTDDYYRIGAGLLLPVVSLTLLFAWFVLRPRLTLTGILLIPVMFAVALYQSPRFELLSSHFVCLAIPLLFRSEAPSFKGHAALAVLVALTALAQPTVGFYASVALAMALLLWSRSLAQFLALAAGYAAAVLAIVVLATELHPQLSFAEWLGALLTQARVLSGRSDGSFIFYNITEPGLFLKLVYLLSLPLLGLALWREAGGERSLPWKRPLLAALFLLAAVVVWFTSIRLPGTVYNLVGLAPIILYALHLLANRSWPGRPLALALLAAALVGSSASIAYRAAFAWQSVEGVSAASFRTAIAPLGSARSEIGAPSQLIPYVAQVLPQARLVTWPRAEFVETEEVRRLANRPPPILIVVQADSGWQAPPEQPGYRLALDRFHRSPPAVAGMTIGRTRKDFAFAVYCRPEACAELAELGRQAEPR